MVALLSTPPELRDFSLLEALLVHDEAACLRDGFNASFGNVVDVIGRVEVLRRQTFRRSDDEILVRSCERASMLLVRVAPEDEPSGFTGGGIGRLRSNVMSFRRDAGGQWRHAGSLQIVPECSDIEPICEGCTDDLSSVPRPSVAELRASPRQRSPLLGRVRVVVDLTLDPAGGGMQLAGSGTRALLFRFSHGTLAGMLTSADGIDFQAGGEYRGATIEFWNADPVQVVVGAPFVVWCRGDVGLGVVTSIAIAS